MVCLVGVRYVLLLLLLLLPPLLHWVDGRVHRYPRLCALVRSKQVALLYVSVCAMVVPSKKPTEADYETRLRTCQRELAVWYEILWWQEAWYRLVQHTKFVLV